MSGYHFWVPGVPVPKARARTVVRKGKAHSFTPRATELWEWKIAEAAVAHSVGKLSGPLSLTCCFWLPKPKSIKRVLPAVRPDLDNLVKAVLDGLRETWEDDAQVVVIQATKLYSGATRAPGVKIAVRSIDNVEVVENAEASEPEPRRPVRDLPPS